jgi:hypothetical protein
LSVRIVLCARYGPGSALREQDGRGPKTLTPLAVSVSSRRKDRRCTRPR